MISNYWLGILLYLLLAVLMADLICFLYGASPVSIKVNKRTDIPFLTESIGGIVVMCGIQTEFSCDSVILSVGYKEENTLYYELEFEVPEIYLLGDAKKVSNIMYAIWDAYEVANHI